MAMFDRVRSELPLPGGFAGELRSNDFDCILTTILIRADGRLMVEKRDFEEVPPAERPFPDDPAKSSLGRIRSTHKGWRDMEYHGDFRFYGYEPAQAEKPVVWHEYVARFTHGTLEYIENEHEVA